MIDPSLSARDSTIRADLPAPLGVDAGVVGAAVAVTALAVDDRLLAGVCLAAHEAGELHVIKHVNAPVDCATMTQRINPD